jgi:hypothetical protein
VSSFAGQGPVTLRISVQNVGQPTLDTAVLIDAITIN